MTCFSTLTKAIKLHIQHYDLFCVKCLEKLYMTNSEFISLDIYWAAPCFTNHILKSPFLIQESITSTQAEPLHVLSVPHKVQSVGRPTAAQVRTELFPLLHAFHHSFTFLPLKYSPQPLSSHLLKSYPLKDSSQIPTIFFRMTSLLKPWQHILSLIEHLTYVLLCCNYLNFSYLYPNQVLKLLYQDCVSSVFSSSIVTVAITSPAHKCLVHASRG